MKRIGLVFVGLLVCGTAMAGTPLTFDTATTDEASIIWTILAGQGPWGVLLFAILGVVWKFSKPYLDAWVASKKLETLYGFAKTAVQSVKQTYVDEIKAASADGTLTNEEKAVALNKAKTVFIALAKTQGIDVVKEYGMELIELLIEKFVGDSKEASVIVPLSDELPMPTSVKNKVQEPPLPDLQQ